MTQVEKLEREIAALSQAELAEFRRWFADFDAARSDEQLEADIAAGKLDPLGDEALGRTSSASRRAHLRRPNA